MTSPAAALKVVIVAENASTGFGGEAILPWHYFRLLYERGIDVHLVVHERTRAELARLLPEAAGRMHFVPDLALQKWLFRMSDKVPPRIFENTLGIVSHAATCLMQRKLVRQLVRTHGIQVIHEPTPVSPKQPSFMYDMGAPVVIGPMNGGMDFPPGFSQSKSVLERVVVNGGRSAAHYVNTLIPGKLRAAALLVANDRTRQALPRSATSHVISLVENGVDLDLFTRRVSPAGESARFDASAPVEGRAASPESQTSVRFAFMGRLVDWKRVDLLLEALAKCPLSFHLSVLGDGPLRPALEAQVLALGLQARVTFRGQLSQAQCSEALAQTDALVLPSMRECGGAVVLEAMAMGLPVIATDWGGPRDYVDASTGILVAPSRHEDFVVGLSQAMQLLGESPELRSMLGAAGRAKVEREFDWERKIDRILDIYADAAQLPRVPLRGTGPAPRTSVTTPQLDTALES